MCLIKYFSIVKNNKMMNEDKNIKYKCKYCKKITISHSKVFENIRCLKKFVHETNKNYKNEKIIF